MDTPKRKLHFTKIQELTDAGKFEEALVVAIEAMREAQNASDQKSLENYRETIEYVLRAIDASFGVSRRRSLTCTFCGKSEHEASRLIAGPHVFICNECVDLCNEIIREDSIET